MRDYAVHFLTSAGFFAAALFIPIYAAGPAIRATEAQLGVIVSGGAFAGFLSSFLFGRLADVRGRRAVLLLGVGATAGTLLLQVLAADPLSLGVTWFLLGVTGGMFPGALLAIAYEGGRRMGRFSSFGSLGWGLGTFLSGTVVALVGNVRWSFVLAAALFLAAFVFAAGLRPARDVPVRVPLFPVAVIRRNWPAYAAVLIRHTGANMIWVIFPLFLVQDLRVTEFELGVLYTTNALTQFVFMLLVVDRFRSTRLVPVGLALSGLTFLSFTLARNFWEMWPTQVALGVSWAFLYVGSLNFVLERGVERATSGGLLNSALAVGATLGPLLGGVVAEGFGREAAMVAAAGLAGAALAVFLLAVRSASARAAPT